MSRTHVSVSSLGLALLHLPLVVDSTPNTSKHGIGLEALKTQLLPAPVRPRRWSLLLHCLSSGSFLKHPLFSKPFLSRNTTSPSKRCRPPRPFSPQQPAPPTAARHHQHVSSDLAADSSTVFPRARCLTRSSKCMSPRLHLGICLPRRMDSTPAACLPSNTSPPFPDSTPYTQPKLDAKQLTSSQSAIT